MRGRERVRTVENGKMEEERGRRRDGRMKEEKREGRG